MAERRMFHTTVVESDAFLDLPSFSQLLYFHLGMHADDDGFINGPKQIARKLHCPGVHLKKLIDTGFLLEYEGIVVLTHWRVANSLRKDRMKPLQYPDFAKLLFVQENGAYTFSEDTNRMNLFEERATIWQPSGNQMPPKVREDKVSEDKVKEDKVSEFKGREGKDTADAVSDVCTPKEDSGHNHILSDKGVIHLTPEQVGLLTDRMGLNDFTYYVGKLAKFLRGKNVSIKDHCATILRWWEEDKGV